MEKAVRDSYGRTIEYMRISITDRCNLRCRYCMPDGAKWIPMSEILTYEEIERICREAVRIGITRFKITGGEPLVRKGCADLIRMIRQIPGTEEVTMTTNGVLLGENLEDLLAAGLDAVNISLDTLIPEKYQEITGADELERVRKSIFMAEKSDNLSSGSHSAQLRINVSAFSFNFAYVGNPAPPAPTIPFCCIMLLNSFISIIFTTPVLFRHQ